MNTQISLNDSDKAMINETITPIIGVLGACVVMRNDHPLNDATATATAKAIVQHLIDEMNKAQ